MYERAVAVHSACAPGHYNLAVLLSERGQVRSGCSVQGWVLHEQAAESCKSAPSCARTHCRRMLSD